MWRFIVPARAPGLLRIDDTETVWDGTADDIPCPGDYLVMAKPLRILLCRYNVCNGQYQYTLDGSGYKILNLLYSIRSVYFP